MAGMDWLLGSDLGWSAGWFPGGQQPISAPHPDRIAIIGGSDRTEVLDGDRLAQVLAGIRAAALPGARIAAATGSSRLAPVQARPRRASLPGDRTAMLNDDRRADVQGSVPVVMN